MKEGVRGGSRELGAVGDGLQGGLIEEWLETNPLS